MKPLIIRNVTYRTLFIVGIIVCVLMESISVEAKNNAQTHKLSKYTLKEVKRLEKEGWTIFEGDPSIGEQLENSWSVEFVYDEDEFPKYVIGYGTADSCKTLKEAEVKAMEWAKWSLYNASISEFNLSSSTEIQSDGNSVSTTEYRQYCMNELVLEGWTTIKQTGGITSITNDVSKIYWDAVRRTCFKLPLIKNARTLIRLYRKINSGYEVIWRLCGPAKTSCIKIGNLYYYLDDSNTFLEFDEDFETSWSKPRTAEVTYHQDYANLEEVTIPAKVVYNDRTYNVIGICDNAFSEGRYIRELKYPTWIDVSKTGVPFSAELIAYNPQPPLLAIQEGSLVFTDSTHNNRIDAEEHGAIQFTIVNNGKGDAENCKVKVQLRGTTNGISTSTSPLPTIGVGQTYAVKIPVVSDIQTKDGQVTFSIEIYEPSGWGIAPFDLTVATKAYEPPLVQVVDYSVSSNSGQIKKMEIFTLTFNIQNTQYGDAEDVNVKIKMPKEIFLMDGKTEYYIPLLKSGEAKAIKISMVTNNNYTLEQIPIAIDIKEKHGKYAENRDLEIALNSKTFKGITIAAKDDFQQNKGSIQLAMMSSEVDRNIPQTDIQNTNTFVVIIANEDYKNVASVPFAKNDGSIFQKYCQKTLGIPVTNIHYVENASYNDIRIQLAWLKDVCDAFEGKASLIVYYAGHGIPDEASKSAYLLPIDGDGRYVQSAYKIDDLYQKLGAMNAKSVTVFMDACFSGSKREEGMLASARAVAIKVKSGEPQGNMVVFSAAQGDETAYPDNDEQHGMFTYYLLKKLQETNGDVTLRDLGTYVTTNVRQQSIVKNGKTQTPTVTASHTLGSDWQNWKLK